MVGCVLLLMVFVLCVLAGQAFGAEAPRWTVTTQTVPANLPLSGGSGTIIISATNVGGASTDGSQVAIGDVLPASLTAEAISGYDTYRVGAAAEQNYGELLLTGSSLYGLLLGSGFEECTTSPLRCTSSDVVDPGDVLTVTIKVKSSASSERSEVDTATASGGGAAAANTSPQLRFSENPAPFGPTPGSVLAAVSSTRAGAHPNVTTAFGMNVNTEGGGPAPAGYAKDISFELPRGLVGSTKSIPRCDVQALREAEEKSKEAERTPYPCPQDSMVGMAAVTLINGTGAKAGVAMDLVPVYNIAPAAGEPAAFTFFAQAFGVRLDTSVLSNGNDAVRVTSTDTTQLQPLVSASVTVWGVPAEHSGPGEDRWLNDASENGLKKVFETGSLEGTPTFGGPNGEQQGAHALLSNPTQCSQPMEASFSADSWSEPSVFVSSGEGPVNLGVASDCEALSFSPSFSMAPEDGRAGEPAGYGFQLTVPQNEGAEELQTSELRDLSVTLPAGTVIDPSAANGLKSCAPSAFYGPHHGEQSSASAGECPGEAKIGSVEILAPALSEALHGWVYLGEPECSPCSAQDAEDGRMVKLFVEAFAKGEPSERVLVKLEGHGYVNQSTGQITTRFVDQPQLPFSNLRLNLFGGPNAPLANPRSCGTYAVGLEATPWSGNGTVSKESSFGVNEDCIGSVFAPAFTAGTENNQAGGFGTFTLSLAREDSNEYLGGIQTTLPPGVLAMISSVSQCGEAQANEGTCPSSSLIGHTSVLVGPGSDPYTIEGGQVFLTGPYGGAPFGLSIVVPANAGPYTLSGTTGKGTVVVRAKIAVNPSTAQATVTSNPFPSELDGIPLQVRRVNVNIDREGFAFNATNCGAESVTGTVTSTQGASEGVSSPYRAANCAALAFHPSFSVSTQGATSKAKGASLTVKVNPLPGQANIAKVDLQLPKQLPARLTTLQKACTEAQFNANPAGCPEASFIGSATARTPVLNGPLTGPAILVSHGGAAFPDVEFVLQGENGVEVVLDGATQIKNGITYSKFETVPDVPVSSFETVLPEGPHSVLGTDLPASAKYSLCGQSLTIPTTITGQNGAVVKQTTKIAVTGCPTAISISSHKVSGKTTTLSVYVPAAGELTASGKGLVSASKPSKGQEDVTIAVSQKRAGKLKTKIKLTFTPSKGKKQSKNLTVEFKR